MSQKKAVVLVSGGLDSATCLAMAKTQGFDCYVLSVDYGQKARAELNAAKKIAEKYQAKEHQVIKLSIGELGGSALTDATIDIPTYKNDKKIPTTYVPARNTVFLSIALGWAEILKAHAIFIGVSNVDYSGYPDCRPEYIDAFQNMANLATKTGIEGNPIHIFTPLINLSKGETIRTGNALGVDYSLTVTCYQASDDGMACGECDSCEIRRRGFAEAGIEDPTRYRQKAAAL